jgi:invasion protein IalB
MSNWTKIAAASACAALALMAGTAVAQQQKAPAKQQAAPPAAAAPAAGQQQAQGGGNLWVKLCEKAPFAGKDKDGKDIREEKDICLTHHEQIEATSGMVLVSAALRQIQGQQTPLFMVMVPLGVALQPGLQVGIYTKDLWDKAQKGEKIDEKAITPIKLPYTLCHAAGCTGEVEATPELVNNLKTGGGLVVLAVHASGRAMPLPMALSGFDKALDGTPADPKLYSEQRRDVMIKIAENQKRMIEEQRKQNDELQKMQPNPAAQPKAAPAAAAPAAPPAKKP